MEVIYDPSKSIKTARKIFEGAKYPATEDDINLLSDNILLLEERGLSKLNQRLIDSGRKIWDTFSEHNFAVTLISQNPKSTSIEYEPDEGLQRPIDFKIKIDNITYWIQMKNLAKLERENRQDKFIAEIKRSTKKIKIGKFFNCDLSPQFNDIDIQSLTQFIGNVAKEAHEGSKFYFPNVDDYKAEIEFWLPQKINLDHLTLGISGDSDMVELTGLAETQIKDSLLKASGAFEWEVDSYIINLIALDTERHQDIDVCNAIFGTEHEIIRRSHRSWSRGDDGLFKKHTVAERISGIIAMKRKVGSPVSKYNMMLYINEKFKDQIDTLSRLVSFKKVIHYNMRTPWGKWNFNWV